MSGGIVKLENVSDFIAPSQACILPLPKTQANGSELVGRRAKGEKPKNEVAKITVSLKDCLACSGCVTTAEAVLIKSQTVEEMMEGMKRVKCSIVTVSPQSISSLANNLGISVGRCAVLISSYFKSLGAQFAIDSSIARMFSLEAIACEVESSLESTSKRTVITGICPGFVCYAEKKNGKGIVDLISRVRSPQAIAGALVKDYFSKINQIPVEDIYHVAVMPCYDKKLESSRNDFLVPNSNVREVDCVVTPVELQPLLREYQSSAVDISSSSPFSWLSSLEHGFVQNDLPDEYSGGYAAFVLRRLSSRLEQLGKEVKISTEKTSFDLEKWSIDVGDRPPIVIMKAYGFRNIQNIVRKISTKKLDADFIEVMACPKGCINGGGQIRAVATNDQNEILQSTMELYSTGSDENLSNQFVAESQRIRDEWSAVNPNYQELLLTELHEVEKLASNSVSALSW